MGDFKNFPRGVRGADGDARELRDLLQRVVGVPQQCGTALAEIRDSRLYRETHKNFTDYCREKWQMGESQAYRMIDAANVAQNISPIGEVPPANESQVRPLASLPPEKRREVWKEAVETAPKREST
jgi:hypothetical protein